MASYVHRDDHMYLHSTLVWLGCRVINDESGKAVIADLLSLGLDDGFVSLTRVAVAAEARLRILMLVEARDQAPVGDHHWHPHVQVVHFMALVILQLGRRKAIVHRHLDSNRVCPPALPVLFGEPIAPVLDNSDGQTALVKRLPGDVVA